MKKKTNYAILGVLTLGPQSGYDIKKFIEDSIAHFWQESYGQLYPALKQMVKEGFVTLQIVKTEGKPDKKVYTITGKGREILQAWLQKPVEALPKIRHDLLLKLFFGNEVSNETNIKHIEIHKEHCQQSLNILTGIKTMIEKEMSSHPGSKFWVITVLNGIHALKAQINWADESINILQGIK